MIAVNRADPLRWHRLRLLLSVVCDAGRQEVWVLQRFGDNRRVMVLVRMVVNHDRVSEAELVSG